MVDLETSAALVKPSHVIMTLSTNHRSIDGALGAESRNAIKMSLGKQPLVLV